MRIFEAITFSDAVGLVIGALLILLPLFLKARSIRHLLKELLPQTPFTKKLLHLLSIVFLLIIEVIGVHLLLDPLVPGQGKIRIELGKGAEKPERVIEDLRIELAPVQLNGQTKLSDIKMGAFDQSGVYSTIIKFDWGEHGVHLRVYDQTQPSQFIRDEYHNVSPYVRAGLWDMSLNLGGL